MSSEDEHEAHIRGLLERAGFTVNRIQEAETQRADYRISFGDERYILEVKSRLDDKQRLRVFGESLATVGKAIWEERIEPKRAIDELLKKAADQIEAVAEAQELRIVWLSALGHQPRLAFDQFYASIYGRVGMLVSQADGLAREIPCYYYYESAFYRHRVCLDAVVIYDGNRARLCINDLSPRVEGVRRSALASFFEPGVLDPVADECRGAAYIADCSIDRRENPAGVLEYVRRKYKQPKLLPFQPTSVSSTVLL